MWKLSHQDQSLFPARTSACTAVFYSYCAHDSLDYHQSNSWLSSRDMEEYCLPRVFKLRKRKMSISAGRTPSTFGAFLATFIVKIKALSSLFIVKNYSL
mmetsp:Transcript_4462/g.6929  ORF Transcript_4462/g.6929 Transcript_4462/m.6929 type:complete len:99 (+) Transcript_4462:116-412(+)